MCLEYRDTRYTYIDSHSRMERLWIATLETRVQFPAASKLTCSHFLNSRIPCQKWSNSFPKIPRGNPRVRELIFAEFLEEFENPRGFPHVFLVENNTRIFSIWMLPYGLSGMVRCLLKQQNKYLNCCNCNFTLKLTILGNGQNVISLFFSVRN